MLFPKSRMKFVTTLQGKAEPEGWIVLDLKGFDLEGVTGLALPIAELEAVKQSGDKAADKLNQARALLGGLDAKE